MQAVRTESIFKHSLSIRMDCDRHGQPNKQAIRGGKFYMADQLIMSAHVQRTSMGNIDIDR